MRNLAVAPRVADTETTVTGTADAHAVTNRSETGSPDVELVEQIDVVNGLVGRETPSRLCYVGDYHRVGDEQLLIRPSLVERVLNRLLAECDPDQGLNLVVVREILAGFVVPARVALVRPLGVEVVGIEGTDVEYGHRHGRARSEKHTGRGKACKHRLFRQALAEHDQLVLGIGEATCRRNLVGRDKVLTENRPSFGVVRRIRHDRVTHHFRVLSLTYPMHRAMTVSFET
ncbi:MAG: hypothetical protein JWO50_326 [Candidatus Kaiserbacteria bacterium]|nr:hypothetical protein [Candidatus Kaiserbacteria bacterium]